MPAAAEAKATLPPGPGDAGVGRETLLAKEKTVKGLEARLQLPELTDPRRQRRAYLNGSLPSPGAFLSLANPSLAGRSRGGEKYAGVWLETSVRWRGEDPDRGARRGESGSSRSGRSRRATAWRQPRLPSKCG
ncbi:unnamed protein product [Rangifer tarandus platyrhynchus]|uniref:Uncharacterized protein n=1 Tax=Rangifer tarandus platyrhynchus TaxID=3082113 RepID=A0ABN8YPM4_RANTA|nr:unnamed protein product [Rangifer tarandus platyrhynchus]